MGNVGRVGRKMEELANQFSLFTPYSIYDCTIDRYVSIFVEDNHKAIVKKGVATKRQVLEAINSLSFAFAEAKGDNTKSEAADREKLIKLSIESQRLQIAMFIFIRDFDYCLEIFKDLGLKTNLTKPDMRVSDFIKSQIKKRNADIKVINDRLFKENKQTETVTRQLYVDILENYESNVQITLSEFAAKIKKNKKMAEEYEKIRGSNSKR